MRGREPEAAAAFPARREVRQARSMLAIDWGLSSFRAWRLGPDGTVRQRLAAPEGIRGVASGGFPDALAALLAPFGERAGEPVLLCGMVGSRQGWAEAPYAPCPARAEDIAGALLPVPGAAPVFIVPGLRCRVGGVADVMRGEETQILGLLPGLGPGRHTLCLPGTHSKWAEVEDGAILSFRTAMTGEIFGLMRGASTLAPVLPAEAEEDWEAFDSGLDRAVEAGGLLHHLFGIRAAALVGDREPAALPSFLSGLLIGHEIAALGAGEGPVHVVGAPGLTERYGRGLRRRGRAPRAHGEEATVAGLAAIGRARGLL
jgi:2-dehydro-3-deoxygalactonokinase